jgi:uncharacterized iron-regulated membrane protein
MRSAFVALHRYVGLSLAVFLTLLGLTGSVLAFKEPLDEWLNPRLFRVASRGTARSPLDLATRVEEADPRGRVTYVTLRSAPGLPAIFGVQPRIDPRTHHPFDLDYNQVFVDPISGKFLGRRYYGALAVDREHVIPWFYRLHSSMLLPEHGSQWLLGIVAFVWLAHSCVGLYLTLPVTSPFFRRWRRAWVVKKGSAFQITFDVHRAAGSWFWALLVIMAMTGLGLRLAGSLVRPVLARLSPLTPLIFERRVERPSDDPIVPGVLFADLIAPAEQEAARRGWRDPASSAEYFPQFGVYSVRFHPPSDDVGQWGFGVPSLYFDATNGRLLGEKVPRAGTTADVVMDTQFPLHSGHIGGLAGRIVVSMTGLATATLAMSGVIMWLRRTPLGKSPASRRPAPMA